MPHAEEVWLEASHHRHKAEQAERDHDDIGVRRETQAIYATLAQLRAMGEHCGMADVRRSIIPDRESLGLLGIAWSRPGA